MALNTLQHIRTKVRRLTRSVSPAQLSDNDLDDYINTFVLYDFPEHLRLNALRKQFTFVTNPYQDTYTTNRDGVANVVANPLYDFNNRYITVHPPFYVAGTEVQFSQNREQFFGNYPLTNNLLQIGTGDGISTVFTGTLPSLGGAGILQRQVLFNSIDTNGQAVSLVDTPVVDPVTGYTMMSGNLYAPGLVPTIPPTVLDAANTINYRTGAYTLLFAAPPEASAPIYCQYTPHILSRPKSILFYGDEFVLRPIPDQAYRVNFDVFVRPTELLSAVQRPELDEWWQYVAYGAAKKVFEDRGDSDGVTMIMPEFKKQESLCLRRTLVQQSNERTATIYSQQTEFGSGNYWSGGPF